MTENELIGEIAECLQEALQLQSRVTEVAHFGHRDHSDRSIVISEIGGS